MASGPFSEGISWITSQQSYYQYSEYLLLYSAHRAFGLGEARRSPVPLKSSKRWTNSRRNLTSISHRQTRRTLLKHGEEYSDSMTNCLIKFCTQRNILTRYFRISTFMSGIAESIRISRITKPSCLLSTSKSAIKSAKRRIYFYEQQNV